MDITAPFKSEVLRPITTWVIPGSIAIAPYVLVLAFHVPQVASFLKASPSAAAAVITICVLSAGLILDNFGSSIESGWWDRLLQRRYPNHLNDWHRYLKLRINDEIIAHRYLKTILMRMKFELSMAPALLIFWIGLSWLNWIYGIWLVRGFVFITILIFAGVLYFLRSSYTSARVLSRLRAAILDVIDGETAFGSTVPLDKPASE